MITVKIWLNNDLLFRIQNNYSVSVNYIGTIIFKQLQINQNIRRLYFNGLMGAVAQL